MITTGEQLSTFITGLNAEAAPDPTLLSVLVGTAQAVLEEERPWMVLRKTDTSKSVTTSSTWQTAIDLSTITDFSRFYSDAPIRLFDGSNTVQYYRLVPFDRRLDYKDASNTATYNPNTKQLYLNGTVPFNGTLYISYISTSTAIDITSASAVWSLFPSRFLPIIGFYAMGILKGAVDYDDINRAMLPENRAALEALRSAMVAWDNALQASDMEWNDPTDFNSPDYARPTVRGF
jgi:hypothetical protein